MNSPLSLIVTADDFGFGVPTSRGIIRAHQAGVVTSTSLMVVTGDHASASIPLLEQAPDLEVGLHLVMTGPAQKPLVATKSSGLVARDGHFKSLPQLLYTAWRRQLDRTAVFDEIAAQAERFNSLLGRAPAYVDGHHHSHQLPIIRDALSDSMLRGALPKLARCTIEPPSIRGKVRGSRLRRLVMNRLGAASQPTFAAGNIRINDYCFGMIGTRELHRPQPWSNYFEHLPEAGIVEWFVHPGEMDDSLVGRDSYIAERQVELDAIVRLGASADWAKWAAARTTKSKLFSRVACDPCPAILVAESAARRGSQATRAK